MSLDRVDHLLYGTRDLGAAIDEIEGLLGVRATAGGRHPGEGTRNALIALGPLSYLEILGPDPAATDPGRPRWYGIDGLAAPRLVGWAVRATDLEMARAAAQRAGVTLGPVGSGSRRRPDDTLLSWRFTDPHVVLEDGVVPFLIDWGTTPHPASTAAPGCSLSGLRIEHPASTRVEVALAALGVEVPVQSGPAPAIVATIRTPRGLVELR